VLLGCRRQGATLRIEVWDTGVGIAAAELEAVFNEYHQIGNAARERSRGLGLGLSIVQRLAGLLGHKVSVRSRPGKGSVFAIEVAQLSVAQLPVRLPGAQPRPEPGTNWDGTSVKADADGHRTGTILVIEDDPDLRDLLRFLLEGEGHSVAVAPDGPAALDMVAHDGVRPGLVLADYNLPGGMNGLEAAAGLRQALPGTPVIILTGDISTATLQEVARQECRHLNKPVRPNDLVQLVQGLLPASPASAPIAASEALAAPAGAHAAPIAPVVFVVDDDADLRAAFRNVLEEAGHLVEDYPGGGAFLGAYQPGREGCLLVDAAMPGMDGFEVLRRLGEAGNRLPAIMITGHGDIAMAVRAMKAGALDFIEKPVSMADLLAGVGRALDQSHDVGMRSAWHAAAAGSLAALTGRQRDVMAMVLAGHPSKNIAADLGISQRTVENHRAAIMHKTGTKSLPALARLALAAASGNRDRPGDPAGANDAVA